MRKESYAFLEKLLLTPGPSGFEQEIQKVVRKYISSYADSVRVDVHGNLIANLNPRGTVPVMLAGHCDQIGFMVTHVNEQGFVYFASIGGVDAGVVPGSRVSIRGKKNFVPGVVGHPPVHLTPPGQRGKKVELKELWIDIGASSQKEAEKLIAIGDPITFELSVTKLGENLITSVGCDDRVGVWVVMEALRLVSERLKKSKKKFPVSLSAVSTVQEEVGLRGARTACYSIDPLVGIAVDVTHATDNPGVDPKTVGNVKLGEGPTIARGANVNPVLEKLLMESANKKKLKYQPLSAPSATGTDANAMQISRAGVASALIGIPNRYMHTPIEVVDLRDLDTAANIIAETVLSISEKDTFIPV